ncbi:MAG: glucokinase [Geoglossum simile]|nr:MAG: glucokinase [Geoglossum simile]
MGLLEEAKKVAAEFEYPPRAVNAGVEAFLREMDEGRQSAHPSGMAMIPTYVTAVPNGTEKGLFLAVDLGGTNFRVCSIQLHGNSTFTLTQSKVAIPQELMVAPTTSKQLFAFLAKQLESFLKTHHNEHFELRHKKSLSGEGGEHFFKLGFTFSFPVEQVGINKGYLMRWTKGYDLKDAIGKDICALLQDEIDALGLPVKVAALVNDTVGTLMARSYTSPGKTGTLLGGIFGTGTNGAYVEKLSKITKISEYTEAEYDRSTGEMIVNTEWGGFDNGLRVLPNSPYDEGLDKESVNQGMQMFEKRVSGMFLGEILRRAILALVHSPEARLFGGEASSSSDLGSTTYIADYSPLHKIWGIDTSFLSIVQGDKTPNLVVTKKALDEDLGVSAASTEDAKAVKELVAAIGKRSARLGAVAIGAVVLATGRLTEASTKPKPSSDNTEHPEDFGTLTATSATVVESKASAASLVGQTDGPTSGAAVDPESVVDIGLDGSLVEFFPGFEDYMREALREIPDIGEEGEKRIRFGIAKDGSGVGAALIALTAVD